MSFDVGVIAELLEAQRAYNAWLKEATPAERTAAARATLRYIAAVEDDAPAWYADA